MWGIPWIVVQKMMIDAPRYVPENKNVDSKQKRGKSISMSEFIKRKTGQI